MDAYQSPSETASRVLTRIDSFGLVGIGLYILLTLLPDSSSLVVSWPWVLVWQIALILPWLCLIKMGWTHQIFIKLGFGLDYGSGLAILGLIGATLFAPFPQQTIWYGWATVSGLAALYALKASGSGSIHRLRLLTIQGGVGVAFILTSLGLWISQTLMPELSRLQRLQTMGLDLTFDFSVLELRNWAPIGHQNYVAGYLVLNLPLLLGLSLIATHKIHRFLWGLSVVLGLFTLYTTSSRGGWLGLVIAGAFGFLALINVRRVPTVIRSLTGLGFVAILLTAILTNNRLRSLFNPSFFGRSGGETAFRVITNWTGWVIGRDYPLFGAGPGSVPLLYQKYRPAWAGQEAEWVYQLHSTPAQIWAEFGGWGIALSLGLVGWLAYWGLKLWRSPSLVLSDRVMTWSILSGLAGYWVVALTDYQLDIVAIVGTLLVYIASLLSLLQTVFPEATPPSQPSSNVKILGWGGVGLLIAVMIWMVPVMRAWQLSSLGFLALQDQQTDVFIKNLERSHKLAPWEPYYLNQLSWNLGNLGLQSQDAQFSQQAIQSSQTFFKESIQVSPHQEFSDSSLGWLQLVTRQPQALESFVRASRLIPGKQLVFHNLGLSLWQQGNAELAVKAFALEIVRNPMWLTSPIWRSTQFAAIADPLQKGVEEIYQVLLKNSDSAEIEPYLHRCLGSLYWWQGNLASAEAEWQRSGTTLGLELLALEQKKSPQITIPILKAWLEPQERAQWLEKALLYSTKQQPDAAQVQTLLTSMNRSKTLDQWIKQYAPASEYRREIAGFGVLSRHIDGPAPLDFSPIIENQAISLFFSELFPELTYEPIFDKVLQSIRENLWNAIQPLSQ